MNRNVQIAICVLMAGCSQGASRLQHDHGFPVVDANSIQWRGVDREDFLSFVAPHPYVRLPDQNMFLPADHKLTVFTQSWLDIIDARVRSNFTDEQSKAIPRPMVAIPKVRRGIAQVTTIPLCITLPVGLDGPDSGETTDSMISVDYFGKLSRYEAPCKVDELSVSQLPEQIAWLSRVHPSCKLEINKDSTLSISGCERDSSISNVVKAKGLVFQAMSNWLIVDLSMFTILSTEDHLVSVVAHELGHYYRAHLAASSKMHSFFYSLDQRIWGQRPHPDENLLEIGEGARSVAQIAMSLSRQKMELPIEILNPLLAARERKVGYYTLEDEADELGSEILWDLGIAPAAAVDVRMIIGEYGQKERNLLPGEISIDTCKVLHGNDWHTPDDLPLSAVPVADFLDLHHSACFSAFNLSREVSAHGYDIPRQVRPTSPGNWPGIKATAKGIPSN